jgi:PTH1 family peptidyl-tRNA hydrolase
MKLIVGLGNPGDKYAGNRHNVGFMALERIADRHATGGWRKRFSGRTADGAIGGEKALLLCPETYYNESGRAVSEAARFLKIAPADIIVIHDEIDLALGKVRVKQGGGHAGNNGLRSIASHIGADFVRVRVGVGHPGNKDAVANYVLHDFPKVDREGLDVLLDAIADALPSLVEGHHDRFQTAVSQALTNFRKGEPAPVAPRQGEARRKPPQQPAPQPKPASRHPAGERKSKRQNALAENLKRWLAGRSGNNAKN